jgi:hypothetical protein
VDQTSAPSCPKRGAGGPRILFGRLGRARSLARGDRPDGAPSRDPVSVTRGATPRTAIRPIGPCPRARAIARRASTRAARWSSPPPWTARSPGGASRSSETGRGGGRLPSPTLRRGRRRRRRPRDRWHVRRGRLGHSLGPEGSVGPLGRKTRTFSARRSGALSRSRRLPTSRCSRPRTRGGRPRGGCRGRAGSGRWRRGAGRRVRP